MSSLNKDRLKEGDSELQGSHHPHDDLESGQKADHDAATATAIATASAPPFDQQKMGQEDRVDVLENMLKSMRRRSFIFNILWMGLFSISAIFSVYASGMVIPNNSKNNVTDDSVSVPGNQGPTEENGLSGNDGTNGIDGSTPILYGKDGIIYSDNNEVIMNIGNFIRNLTSGFYNNDLNFDYQNLDHAPGSTYIGRTYFPISDTHGSSILVETFEKANTFVNPITGIRYKIPDVIANFDQNHESNAVSSTELYESKNELQRAKASEMGIAGGYGGMFEASVSSGQRSAMNALSLEDTAVAKSVLYQKTYEAKAEQNLLPYVKPDLTLAASLLPELINIGTANQTQYDKEVLGKYNDFSMIYGDFVVTSVDLGGSITLLSEISHFLDLVTKYSRSVVKASVGGGWGPFSAKADVTNTVAKSSAEQDVKSNSKDTIFVTSGSSVGDLDDPSSVISNLNEWEDKQMQNHLDRSRRSPVVVAEKVTPLYHFLPQSVKYYYKRYMQFKYGTEAESLADITAKFNAETSKTKNALKAMKEELHGEILDIHIPDKSSIRFSSCHWEDGHKITTCTNNDEVVKSLKLYRRSGNSDFSHYWTNEVLCCKISVVIS